MLVPDEAAVQLSEDTQATLAELHGQKLRSYQITCFATDMPSFVAIEREGETTAKYT